MATAPYRHIRTQVSSATRLASVDYLIDGAWIENAIVFLSEQCQIGGLGVQFRCAWAVAFGISAVTWRTIAQKVV